MPKTYNVDDRDLVTTQEAAKIFNYTSDYITKLAREGKIEACKKSRQWFVSLDSIRQFCLKTQEERDVRSQEIREERLRERQERKEATELPELLSVWQSSTYAFVHTTHVALVQTMVILVLGLLVGVSGYGILNSERITQQASVIESAERIAVALFTFISPQAEEEVVSVEVVSESDLTSSHGTESQGSSTAAGTPGSLIVAPYEILTDAQVAEIRNSFSDEVNVSVDPMNPDSGIIVPRFRERSGDRYRFLIAPIVRPTSDG